MSGEGLAVSLDPSLDGLSGAVSFSSDLSDGATLDENLFDGSTLHINCVARLFFRHESIGGVEGILTKESTKSLSTDARQL